MAPLILLLTFISLILFRSSTIYFSLLTWLGDVLFVGVA